MTDPANPSDNGNQPAPAPTPTPTPNPPTAVARHLGHELPFVTPSTYLRAPTTATVTSFLASAAPQPSSHSRTIPPPTLVSAPDKPLMTPLDRDQVQGLVSILCNQLNSIL